MSVTSFSRKGVLVGARQLVFARITAEGTDSTTYDTEIKRVPGTIELGMMPSISEDQLGADDNPTYEMISELDSIDVAATVAALGNDLTAYLLGAKVDDNGVLVSSKSDVAPYVAMGVEATRSDGKLSRLWLYRGKFKMSEEKYRTKEKGKVNWQTPTLSGTFGPRLHDARIRALVNEDDEGVTAAKFASFLDTVYEPTFTPDAG